MHQSIIGLEALKQMEMAEDYPDIIVGCTGIRFWIIFPFCKKQYGQIKKPLLELWSLKRVHLYRLLSFEIFVLFEDVSVGMAPVPWIQFCA